MFGHGTCIKLVFYASFEKSMLLLKQTPSISSSDHIISDFNFLVFMKTRVCSRKHALLVVYSKFT